jgi:hypothetical protein
MRRFTTSLLLSIALAGPAVAQGLAPSPNSFLPELPAASELSQGDIGQHFRLSDDDRGTADDERVFYVGVSPAGRAIAYSATDTPEHRRTFSETMSYCSMRGENWRLPTLDELRMLTAHADAPDTDYLPGSYWTSTHAPCFDCLNPEMFMMAYDVRTGNVRNNYSTPIIKNYPLCAYDIP